MKMSYRWISDKALVKLVTKLALNPAPETSISIVFHPLTHSFIHLLIYSCHVLDANHMPNTILCLGIYL